MNAVPPRRTTCRLWALAVTSAVVAACDSGGGDPAGPDSTGPLEPLTLAVISAPQPAAFPNDTVSVVVEVRDRLGRVATDVWVRFGVRTTGDAVADTIAPTTRFGQAETRWRLSETLGRHELAISLAERPTVVDQVATDVIDLALADRIVVDGGGGNFVTLLLLRETTITINRLPPPDTVLRLLPRDGADVVTAFVSGRVPALVPVAWTEAPDSVTLSFAAPFPIPLTVWVLEEFDQTAALVRNDVAYAAGLWSLHAFGLEAGPLRIEDATAHAGAAITCEAGATIGFDSSAINVYYARNAQILPFGGLACSVRTILMRSRAGQAPSMLLAHELGHTFGLGHVTDAANFMDPRAQGAGAYTGQVFFAHFYSGSALNAVYGLHPPQRWCDRELICLSQTFRAW